MVRGCALVAALFLDDLDEHDLAATDHLLDLVATHQPPATPGDLLLHDIVIVPRKGLGGVLAVLAVVIRTGGCDLVVVIICGRFGHQRFTVGDRNLVVIGVDLVEGEEAVSVAAILDEGGLERRLHPSHLGEIDVPAKLFVALALEIELFNSISVDHRHARLFGVGSIDKHLL